MKLDTKLAILLATYNSARFLEAQLDSLFQQTVRDWVLYIRDDGSIDSTLAIIAAYRKKYSNIVLLEDEKKGLGAMNSFMVLLAQVETDYYLFCDHDDVWLPNKIELTFNRLLDLEIQNPETPIIVHTDLQVVDQNLDLLHPSFWKMSAIKPHVIENKNLIQVFNCVTGCTMAFNQEVKELAFPYVTETPMHDWWLAIVTVRNKGLIEHLPVSTILYRQHGNNEVGARNTSFSYFVNKIKNLKTTMKGHLEHIAFLQKIKGLGAMQYYYYKIYYTLIRKI